MSNVGAIIKRHNANVGPPAHSLQPRHCNCRKPDQCPLTGKCLTSSIVYRVAVTANGTATPKYYIGSTDTTFKQRCTNHKASFAAKANQTTLSQHIWSMKRDGIDYHISWEVMTRAPAHSSETKRCDLCLTEKLFIATAEKTSLLNKRTELLAKCRHRNKHHLSDFASAPT